MATRPTQAPAPPRYSVGFNVGGLADLLGGAGGSRFNQVYVANGSQRVLLSADTSGDSTALANLRRTANQGILTQTGVASINQSTAPKPGGPSFFSRYKTPIILAGSGVAGLAILAGVFFVVKR